MSESADRSFIVATFYDRHKSHKLKSAYTAYTLWHNPSWDGCIQYTVEARNGTEAKKLAIQKRMEHEASKNPMAGDE